MWLHYMAVWDTLYFLKMQLLHTYVIIIIIEDRTVLDTCGCMLYLILHEFMYTLAYANMFQINFSVQRKGATTKD